MRPSSDREGIAIDPDARRMRTRKVSGSFFIRKTLFVMTAEESIRMRVVTLGAGEMEG